MPIRETKDERLTWAPGEKPKVVMPWLVAAVSHPDVGLPGARLAALLADRFNDKTGGCWMKNGPMAERTGVSISAVKAGLRQLEEAGQIIRVEERIRNVTMRVVYPRENGNIGDRAPRPPRGGVLPGTDPKKRAAEKASANVATAVAQDTVAKPAAPPRTDSELIAMHRSKAASAVTPVFGMDDPGSWSAVMAGAGARAGGIVMRSRGLMEQMHQGDRQGSSERWHKLPHQQRTRGFRRSNRSLGVGDPDVTTAIAVPAIRENNGAGELDTCPNAGAFVKLG